MGTFPNEPAFYVVQVYFFLLLSVRHYIFMNIDLQANIESKRMIIDNLLLYLFIITSILMTPNKTPLITTYFLNVMVETLLFSEYPF